MKQEINEGLNALHACFPAKEFVRSQATWQEAWDNCTELSWMLWILRRNVQSYKFERGTPAQRAKQKKAIEQFDKILTYIHQLPLDGSLLVWSMSEKGKKLQCDMLRHFYKKAPAEPVAGSIYFL